MLNSKYNGIDMGCQYFFEKNLKIIAVLTRILHECIYYEAG